MFLEWISGDPTYIQIEISPDSPAWDAVSVLEEGQWRDSELSGWLYRVDPPDPNIGIQRHVHVAKQKHVKAKNQQRSWNQDGTRHDRKAFNTSPNGIEKAKTVARTALGLSDDVTLEHSPNSDGLLLEGHVRSMMMRPISLVAK